MINKEQVNKLKDYANIADASYAMLHYVNKNEVFDIKDDELRAKIPAFTPKERWIYADNIKLGYKKDDGTPTAYALAIEARFLKDSTLKKPKPNNPNELEFKLIDNEIQSFVYRPKEDSKATQQKILVATTKSQQDSSKGALTYTLSTRTKNFVNRFKLLHHTALESFFSQSGFSATLFQDTQATSKNSEYIFAIRGSNDANDIITDLKDIFASKSNPKEQYFDMLLFYQDCIKQGYITETTPLIVVGHSLGGALAQLFALSFATAENANIIKEVYTFNAPGAKTLQVPYNINPMPHYIIHFTKQDLLSNESINYKLNQALHEYYDTYLQYERQSSITHNFERELETQLWDKAYALKKEKGDNFYLGVYFDPFNAMLPYVTLLEQEEDYRHHFVLSYYHRLYKNYKERKQLASFESTYHIETKEDAKDFIPVLGYPNNATQHLWTDIDGYYYAINIGGITGIPSHYLKYTVRTLYFYSYLLELDSNLTFFESNLDKTIQSLNSVVTSIVKILYHTDSYNKKRDEAIRTANDNGFDLDPPSNHIYATIDKTLFEATLKTTNKDKFSIDEKTLSNMIDGILYLQDNNIFLKLLSKDNMQQADKNTNLAILLAIHENLFFISVDTANNKEAILIKDKDSIVQLLKHNATRTQIFCYNLEHIDDKVIKGYANEALKYYPQFKEAQ